MYILILAAASMVALVVYCLCCESTLLWIQVTPMMKGKTASIYILISRINAATDFHDALFLSSNPQLIWYLQSNHFTILQTIICLWFLKGLNHLLEPHLPSLPSPTTLSEVFFTPLWPHILLNFCKVPSHLAQPHLPSLAFPTTSIYIKRSFTIIRTNALFFITKKAITHLAFHLFSIPSHPKFLPTRNHQNPPSFLPPTTSNSFSLKSPYHLLQPHYSLDSISILSQILPSKILQAPQPSTPCQTCMQKHTQGTYPRCTRTQRRIKRKT